MNPIKFCKEIEAEQCKQPNTCIYHLSKTHQTETCSVKKECDKLISATTKSGATSVPGNSTSGQLCHISEEYPPQVANDDLCAASDEDLDNDTKDEVLNYLFVSLSTTYI
jgi:hypothetical protein